MKKRHKIKIAVVILLELLLSAQLLALYYHDSIFTGIFTVVLSGIVILALGLVALADFIRYKSDRRKKAFQVTTICLLAALILAIPPIIIHSQKYSESMLYCKGNLEQFDEMDLNFRKNGTCEIITQGLASVTSRCSYTLRDSLITLHKNYMDTLLISNHIIIRKYTDSTDRLITTLQQVDDHLQPIPNSNVFTIAPSLPDFSH